MNVISSRRHSLGVKRLALCVCLLSLSACGQTDTVQDDSSVQAESVILLTGFEPFGPERPANPSWEGIKLLDGQDWQGYRLVCKEMKVTWGAPREQLQAWIAEHQPIAILSFGQGLAGGFSLESVAFNERGSHPDNDGQRPPNPQVVADGPRQFKATLDCKQFVQSLSDCGYPIRVSTNAGRYLCEETLYTLEYLKAKDQLETTVLFCHVPPLGSKSEDRLVDAKYIRQFVEDALDTWHAMLDGNAAAPVLLTSFAGPVASAEETREKDPRHQEVETLIRHYFTTWSNQEMDDYGACFASGAAIQFVDSRGGINTFPLSKFLAGQKEAHRRARYRQTEVPEVISIRFEAELARAVVYWKLTSGPSTVYGYDHFTLIKSRDKWKIANLLFYETKR